MAVVTDEDEVYTHLGGIFLHGPEKDGWPPNSQPRVLRVRHTDPGAVVTVDMPNRVVETGASSMAVPSVELVVSADMGNKFWLRKVNLTVAMGKGTVRTNGHANLIMLIPQAKNLFPEYRLMLEGEHRQDLIDA
ncbi:sterol carrier protein [Candidatus Mycolicibacterium alkanivorans]|uniref:Sterol carrier protein n=1 Tax=Candidatus Mycolicibacterium alkanivorans TaxID=2954114 RepID=A0ABS9Z0I0_9MYCO|nr:sterol carrier protein [Candidatus Mycolicibacterium alkanivorans]MCI4676473.1 sterol carrier protein [Candidatus Mycolicibacterium alkanivorans]